MIESNLVPYISDGELASASELWLPHSDPSCHCQEEWRPMKSYPFRIRGHIHKTYLPHCRTVSTVFGYRFFDIYIHALQEYFSVELSDDKVIQRAFDLCWFKSYEDKQKELARMLSQYAFRCGTSAAGTCRLMFDMESVQLPPPTPCSFCFSCERGQILSNWPVETLDQYRRNVWVYLPFCSWECREEFYKQKCKKLMKDHKCLKQIRQSLRRVKKLLKK
jgi:hypothetical protein